MIATALTTYSEPFNLARQFASLSHQQRTCGVEHRHVVARNGGRQLQRGRPVPVQAGSSDTGRRVATRHAEAVSTRYGPRAVAHLLGEQDPARTLRARLAGQRLECIAAFASFGRGRRRSGDAKKLRRSPTRQLFLHLQLCNFRRCVRLLAHSSRNPAPQDVERGRECLIPLM